MIEKQDELHLEIKNKFKKEEPIRLGAALLAVNLVFIYFLIQLFTLIDVMFWFLLLIAEIVFLFLGISTINRTIRILKSVYYISKEEVIQKYGKLKLSMKEISKKIETNKIAFIIVYPDGIYVFQFDKRGNFFYTGKEEKLKIVPIKYKRIFIPTRSNLEKEKILLILNKNIQLKNHPKIQDLLIKN